MEGTQINDINTDLRTQLKIYKNVRFHGQLMSPGNKTYFSTVVKGKFGNIRIPSSIVSLPCSAEEKCHVLVDVVVESIDGETNHFCCFAPGPEIAFPFAVCKENSMLTEWGTSRFPTRRISALALLARQLYARWGSDHAHAYLLDLFLLLGIRNFSIEVIKINSANSLENMLQ